MDFLSALPWWSYFVFLIVLIGLRDLIQKKHTIRNNFPVIGNIRYWFESIGPELRQYIVANNREELPFNRRQRSWVYASSKQENNFQGFGSDQNMSEPGYIFIKPSMLPKMKNPNSGQYQIQAIKTIGKRRNKPYKPTSIINISAMSYGSLSSAAVSALNQGAHKFGCYHNTGEGGIAPYHKFGADLCFQIGTAYFGVRDENGNFDINKLKTLVNDNPNIKLIELKLSQGAKPGKGGVLPGPKITKEISEIRHIPMGKDAISPAYHSAFGTVSEMIDFIESIAEATGLPVGIKSAVGKLDMWHELAHLIKTKEKGPDFITIDGGEGGTGAAPPSFADHVSLPWVHGFSSVYKVFQEYELCNKITFIGSGKLGLPDSAIMAMSMGADLINIAREPLLSIGCIQAQVCHTNRCPTGIATNNKWLEKGLDPSLKSERFYNYMKVLSKEINEITFACGYEHPSQFTMNDIDIAMGDSNSTHALSKVYGYEKTPVTKD
jgi:glutamate synthase domain-containing protein 2